MAWFVRVSDRGKTVLLGAFNEEAALERGNPLASYSVECGFVLIFPLDEDDETRAKAFLQKFIGEEVGIYRV